MKTTFTKTCLFLTIASLSVTLTADAQQTLSRSKSGIFPGLTEHGERFKERFSFKSGKVAPIPQIHNTAAFKTTDTRSRIVATYNEYYDGTTFTKENRDSTRFYWSGSRGGDADLIMINFRNLFAIEYPVSEVIYHQEILLSSNMDSIHNYIGGSSGASYDTLQHRSVNVLNGMGQVTLSTDFILTPGTADWKETDRILIDHTNGPYSVITEQDWSDTSWSNDHRSSFTFNSSGNPVGYMLESWETSASLWERYHNSLLTFSSGLLTEEAQQEWDNGSSAWITNRLYSHTYTGERRTSSIIQRLDGGIMKNRSREDYQHHTNGLVSSVIVSGWDETAGGGAGAWEEEYRVTYEFDGSGNLSFMTEEGMESGSWVLYSRYAYSHTTSSEGQITHIDRQNFDNPDPGWNNSSRFTFRFNNEGKLTSLEDLEWDEDDQEWVHTLYSSRLNVLYESFEDEPGNVSRLAHKTGLICYPNPATNHITVVAEGGELGQIRIMDLTGRVVRTVQAPVGSSSLTLSTATLTPGNYLLQVRHEGRTEQAMIAVR